MYKGKFLRLLYAIMNGPETTFQMTKKKTIIKETI